jgi:hypothetical protein
MTRGGSCLLGVFIHNSKSTKQNLFESHVTSESSMNRNPGRGESRHHSIPILSPGDPTPSNSSSREAVDDDDNNNRSFERLPWPPEPWNEQTFNNKPK